MSRSPKQNIEIDPNYKSAEEIARRIEAFDIN